MKMLLPLILVSLITANALGLEMYSAEKMLAKFKYSMSCKGIQENHNKRGSDYKLCMKAASRDIIDSYDCLRFTGVDYWYNSNKERCSFK